MSMSFNQNISSAAGCLLTNLTYLYDFIDIFLKERPGGRCKIQLINKILARHQDVF
jgi:hypothetical protein